MHRGFVHIRALYEARGLHGRIKGKRVRETEIERTRSDRSAEASALQLFHPVNCSTGFQDISLQDRGDWPIAGHSFKPRRTRRRPGCPAWMLPCSWAFPFQRRLSRCELELCELVPPRECDMRSALFYTSSLITGRSCEMVFWEWLWTK